MYAEVTKELQFCCAHRLYGYDGPCCRIHGHNYRVQVTFGGGVGVLGMVIDFTLVKRALQTRLNEEWDHQLILNEADPLRPVLEAAGVAARTMPCNPTAEAMAGRILQWARDAFPSVSVVKVRVYETETSFAEVRV